MEKQKARAVTVVVVCGSILSESCHLSITEETELWASSWWILSLRELHPGCVLFVAGWGWDYGTHVLRITQFLKPPPSHIGVKVVRSAGRVLSFLSFPPPMQNSVLCLFSLLSDVLGDITRLESTLPLVHKLGGLWSKWGLVQSIGCKAPCSQKQLTVYKKGKLQKLMQFCSQ
jgi:hypothetical protein